MMKHLYGVALIGSRESRWQTFSWSFLSHMIRGRKRQTLSILAVFGCLQSSLIHATDTDEIHTDKLLNCWPRSSEKE